MLFDDDYKMDMVAHACDPDTQEAKVGGLQCVQGQFGLYSEFEPSLDWLHSKTISHKKQTNNKQAVLKN